MAAGGISRRPPSSPRCPPPAARRHRSPAAWCCRSRGWSRSSISRRAPSATSGRRRATSPALRRLDARPVTALVQRGAPDRRRRAGGDGLAVHRPPRAVSVALAAAADPDRRLSSPRRRVRFPPVPVGGPWQARGRAARRGTLLPRGRRSRRPVRRALHHRGAHHRDLLPPVLPGHHAAPGQRRVPAHRRRGPAARIPRLPALPARRGARLAGVEHPRRPGRPGHAPDR